MSPSTIARTLRSSVELLIDAYRDDRGTERVVANAASHVESGGDTVDSSNWIYDGTAPRLHLKGGRDE